MSTFRFTVNYNQSRLLGTNEYINRTEIDSVLVTDPLNVTGSIGIDKNLFIFLTSKEQSQYYSVTAPDGTVVTGDDIYNYIYQGTPTRTSLPLATRTYPRAGTYLRVCDPLDFQSISQSTDDIAVNGVYFKDIPIWSAVYNASDVLISSTVSFLNTITNTWVVVASTSGGYPDPWVYMSERGNAPSSAIVGHTSSFVSGVSSPYRTNQYKISFTDLTDAITSADAIRGSINACSYLFNDTFSRLYTTYSGNYEASTVTNYTAGE